MDVNLQLIALIKSNPVMYDNTPISPSNKAAIWLAIGRELNQSDNWVRSRWYSLKMQYNLALNSNKSKFPYMEEMKFLNDLEDYVVSSSNLESELEFIITQEEMAQDSDEELKIHEEHIEYDVCMSSTGEVDQDSQPPLEEVSDKIELETIQEELEKEIEPDSKPEEPLKLNKIAQEETTEQKTVDIQENEEDIKPEVAKIIPVPATPPEIKRKRSVTPPKVSPKRKVQQEKAKPVKAKVAADSDDDDDEEEEEEVARAPSKKSQSRCADTIFGELVAATLKEMDEKEKKIVKSQIMKVLYRLPE